MMWHEQVNKHIVNEKRRALRFQSYCYFHLFEPSFPPHSSFYGPSTSFLIPLFSFHSRSIPHHTVPFSPIALFSSIHAVFCLFLPTSPNSPLSKSKIHHLVPPKWLIRIHPNHHLPIPTGIPTTTHPHHPHAPTHQQVLSKTSKSCK